MWARARRTGMATAWVAFVASCGPGLETLHESNLRFEHCYRLDMDPNIAGSHRLHCWRDWTQTYAPGQSRDRVEYARRRMITLESGDVRLLDIRGEPQQRQRLFSLAGGPKPAPSPAAAPAPTSAHAPPPATAPDERPQPEPVDELPSDACARPCASDYDQCAEGCKDQAEVCAKCREDYRSCMRRCFE